MPRDFGEYLGKKVVEVEKVCVATSKMRFDEYCQLRGYHFVVSNYYNLKAMKEIVCYLRQVNLSVFEWLRNIQQYLERNSGQSGELYRDFLIETKGELWDRQEELLGHYSMEENYKKLVSGERGANLIMKYWAYCLDNLDDFVKIGIHVAMDTSKSVNAVFMNDLLKYCVAVRGDLFDEAKYDIEESLSFNIPGWVNRGWKDSVNEYEETTDLSFSMTDEQKEIIDNYTKRYGKSEEARGRILAIIGPENLYRRHRYV